QCMISSTANLTFRDVNDNLLADASIIEEGGASLDYQNGAAVVSLKIADTDKFSEITGTLAEQSSGYNMIVTWLDYEEGDSYAAEYEKYLAGEEAKYISVASVSSAIDGDAIISGSFTEEEARELADLISSGSLPVQMTEISSNVVSAEFGVTAFETTVFAGFVGLSLIVIFMIAMYRLPGLIASIMLSLYVFAVFFIYSSMGAVFTLTGIAALVLGVGMTVDANIITFERIKEGLYAGYTVEKACKLGQSQSFSTIFDAQFTTLLAALIMYIFGTGTVKGFATMLMITVVCTLALNVYVSRFLLNCVVDSGTVSERKSWFGVREDRIPNLTKGEEAFYDGPIAKMDFMKDAKKQIMASCAIIVLAIGLMIFNTAQGNGFMNLGIDFSSGTKLVVTSEYDVVLEDVQAEMELLGYTDGKYSSSGDSEVTVTIKDSLDLDSLDVIKAVFLEKYGIEPNDTVVTPVVGQDLVEDAFNLSILAWVVMLFYITVRFKWDYAVSCIVALLHDVFIVLAFFAIFRIEVNIELVSVILAIIGYSINNSIVVFDRIREILAETNKPNLKAEDYKEIVNKALDNTILRSILSSFTTILPVIVLLMIGSSAIYIFNIAMFIGLIVGTLSSIYISPYVWLWIRTHYKPKAKKVKKKNNREELDEYNVIGINS
ncbi:MAG: protein translocase subunit SecF, partial [Erysipelotrichaceae bacterium]